MSRFSLQKDLLLVAGLFIVGTVAIAPLAVAQVTTASTTVAVTTGGGADGGSATPSATGQQAASVQQAVTVPASTVQFPNPAWVVAKIHAQGQYDDYGLNYWNGKPISPTNHPTAYDDQLSSDWVFFVSPALPSRLWVMATNTFDTHYGYITGPPFAYVALTGFAFTLNGSNGSLPSPTFSNADAVPGENLVGPSHDTHPLTDTPGWRFVLSSPTTLSISTPDVTHAFTHFTDVYGTTRINGGGLFSFDYSNGMDLRQAVRWNTLTASATHGISRYKAPGTLVYPQAAPLHPSTIFAVTLNSCTNLHVGYNYFPAGTVVHWNVSQSAVRAASGQFTTLGGGSTYHFLTMRLGTTLRPDPADADVHFSWTINATQHTYMVRRDPGC